MTCRQTSHVPRGGGGRGGGGSHGDTRSLQPSISATYRPDGNAERPAYVRRRLNKRTTVGVRREYRNE
ncbi:hypothetical protein PUN28_005362 [Cardiocondyla obscurior]|uniref:Uncharacterized protein n=1 Tax=Cardiocondyla obscurior TaxID=286306 RepID=A0AAW2GHD6_9HYME